MLLPLHTKRAPRVNVRSTRNAAPGCNAHPVNTPPAACCFGCTQNAHPVSTSILARISPAPNFNQEQAGRKARKARWGRGGRARRRRPGLQKVCVFARECERCVPRWYPGTGSCRWLPAAAGRVSGRGRWLAARRRDSTSGRSGRRSWPWSGSGRPLRPSRKAATPTARFDGQTDPAPPVAPQR